MCSVFLILQNPPPSQPRTVTSPSTLFTSNTSNTVLSLTGGLICQRGSRTLTDGSFTPHQSLSRSGFGQNSVSGSHRQSPSLSLLTALPKCFLWLPWSFSLLHSVIPPSPLSFRNVAQKHKLHLCKIHWLRMLLPPLTPNSFLLSHWKIQRGTSWK